MAAASHGYEPNRLTTLETRTSTAITALTSIASSDPAAWGAIIAVRRLQSILENRWLPAVSTVRATNPLGGIGPALGLGGGGSSSSWDDSAPVYTFQPFNALSALFPGDDDITAEEIVERIREILDARPSEQQLLELGILGRALEQIAQDEELSAAVLLELGPEGLQGVYSTLFGLGLAYPLNPTLGTDYPDSQRYVGFDLPGLIGDPFNLMVSSGAQRPDGQRVVLDAIDLGADAGNAWEAAVLAGLARSLGLPDEVALHLLDVVKTLEPSDFSTGLQDLDNSMYPEIEYDIELLALFAVSNNPVLIETLIYGPDGFVDGGEKYLEDLIETNGFYNSSDDDIGVALGGIFAHIIDITPPDELIVRDADGSPSTTGVIFDLVDLLLENDLKVPGLHVLEAIGPYLPEIMGAIPGTDSKYSPQEVREILVDLFEDLSPGQIEAALSIVVDAILTKLPVTITSADFDGTFPAGDAVGDMLDVLFGPVAGAFGDVVDDEAARAAFWRAAVNDAFGLIPIPGNAIAKWAIKRGVKEIIGGSDGSTDAAVAVAAAQAALIENTVVVLWADPLINAQVVETALADWEHTRIKLGGDRGESGGQQLSTARFEEIRRALVDARDNGGLVDPDVFVDLPQIVALVESVEDETTLSAEREQGN